MKKALRIILPILLTLVILASAMWYLMVYDPDFTRDTILSTAREFDSSGHHRVAAWLYDMAYHQSGGGDEVAIELANHYKSIGNYTKAEYTLSGAISDGGSVELYIALCQTYVEQDKILDAVSMLSNIKDPEIKAQIDLLRPASPTFDLAPGFYSKYVTVNVHSENADLYVNTEGEYPSTANSAERKKAVGTYVKDYIRTYFQNGDPSKISPADLSTVAVALSEGETTIYAVSVGRNNLVSPLSIQGYTVGGIIQDVTLADATLDAHVRQLLNFNTDRTIQSNDLWDITELTVPEEVTDLGDLKNFTYLQKLTISNCGTKELTDLSGLSELKELTITGAELSQDSLKTIGTLRSLEKLTLSNCGLSTIAPLEGLTNLTHLDLSSNALRNIGVFTGFTKLQEVNMSSNVLTDLDAMSALTELKILNISHNSLQSLKPLSGITGLTELYAGNNALQDVEGIGALTGLTKLELNNNILSDISPLSGCTALTELNVSNNSLKDIAVVAQLNLLVRLDFSYNKVKEFPEFPKEHGLGSITASHNELSKLDPLKALKELYFLDIDYNSNVSSLDPIVGCQRLAQVNCFETKVALSPFSENSSIIVNFGFTHEEQ